MEIRKLIIIAFLLLLTSCARVFGETDTNSQLIANDKIPKELHWGTAVAGVSIAFQFENQAHSISGSDSVLAKVYIRNTGNIDVKVFDVGPPLYGADLYTKNDKGDITEIRFHKQANSIISSVRMIEGGTSRGIPQNETYVFTVTIPTEVLNAVSGNLFAGAYVNGPKGIPSNLIYSNEVSPPKQPSPPMPMAAVTPAKSS